MYIWWEYSTIEEKKKIFSDLSLLKQNVQPRNTSSQDQSSFEVVFPSMGVSFLYRGSPFRPSHAFVYSGFFGSIVHWRLY